MILIPGSLSFVKLVMMSSAPAKSAEDARYVPWVPETFPAGFPASVESLVLGLT